MLRGGCKRSFGSREQRSPKSLLHHPKLLLHRCKMGFWVVQKTFRRPLLPGSKRPFAPSPKHFWGIFPFRSNFPGPQLPNFRAILQTQQVAIVSQVSSSQLGWPIEFVCVCVCVFGGRVPSTKPLSFNGAVERDRLGIVAGELSGLAFSTATYHVKQHVFTDRLKNTGIFFCGR